MSLVSGSGLLGRDGDLVAEGTELGEGAVLGLWPAGLIEVGQIGLLIVLVVGEHVLDEAQDRMTNGDGRFLLATAHDQAAVLPRQAGSEFYLGMVRAAGRLGQGAP